jgi:hypothetical protein
MLGFTDGSVDLVLLQNSPDTDADLSMSLLCFHPRRKTTSIYLFRTEGNDKIASLINKQLKCEHKERVEVVDVCLKKKLFCTCR